MTSSLYKLSDLSSRWVKKQVWVSTGYWQPDPVSDPPIIPPDDPIGEQPPTVTYGWIGPPPHLTFGVILPGMTLHSTLVGYGPAPSYTPVYSVYYM